MLKVLIVEDEDIIRRGLVYTMDWLAMDCMVIGDAPNGKEGLRLLAERKPDLVITDIIMPEMGGIEMLEAAARQELDGFKSIVLTSYADFAYARQALRLRVFDYLLKPVDEDALRKAVESARESMASPPRNTAQDTLIDWNRYLGGDMRQNAYVAKVLRKIRDRYQEKLAIESIADELEVSQSYLSRKLKEATAHTFLELLAKQRIQKAICLLKKGTYRVYEVSELVGFSDYKRFCAVFKKYTRTSPREFIKRTSRVMHE